MHAGAQAVEVASEIVAVLAIAFAADVDHARHRGVPEAAEAVAGADPDAVEIGVARRVAAGVRELRVRADEVHERRGGDLALPFGGQAADVAEARVVEQQRPRGCRHAVEIALPTECAAAGERDAAQVEGVFREVVLRVAADRDERADVGRDRHVDLETAGGHEEGVAAFHAGRLDDHGADRQRHVRGTHASVHVGVVADAAFGEERERRPAAGFPLADGAEIAVDVGAHGGRRIGLHHRLEFLARSTVVAGDEVRAGQFEARRAVVRIRDHVAFERERAFGRVPGVDGGDPEVVVEGRLAEEVGIALRAGVRALRVTAGEQRLDLVDGRRGCIGRDTCEQDEGDDPEGHRTAPAARVATIRSGAGRVRAGRRSHRRHGSRAT